MAQDASEASLKNEVIRELSEALQRLQEAAPHEDGERTVRLCVGYFVELYARHFGHAAAVSMMAGMVERGSELAEQELTATRN